MTEDMTLHEDGKVEHCMTTLTQFVLLIENAAMERMARVAEQDPENRGRVAAAIRALKHDNG